MVGAPSRWVWGRLITKWLQGTGSVAYGLSNGADTVGGLVGI